MHDLKIFNEDLIPVYTTDTGEKVVIARELHERLGSKKQYADWIKQIIGYGFIEGYDFEVFHQKVKNAEGGRPATDHILKFDMAKHICMIQRTPIGMEIRQKLIDLEKEARKAAKENTPSISDQIQAIISNPEFGIKLLQNLKEEREKNEKLEIENSRLTVSNEIMRPKSEYFDDLVSRNLLTGIRDTAKELQIKEKVFVNFLIEKGFLYRDKKNKLKPKAAKNNGLFEVKEFQNSSTGYAGQQTLITPKGRETFRLLTEGLRDA